MDASLINKLHCEAVQFSLIFLVRLLINTSLMNRFFDDLLPLR